LQVILAYNVYYKGFGQYSQDYSCCAAPLPPKNSGSPEVKAGGGISHLTAKEQAAEVG